MKRLLRGMITSLQNLFRYERSARQPEAAEFEPPLGPDEDPFDEPVEWEIRDVIDLHSIPPREIRAVVEEYLYQARVRRFRYVRIIHGKGQGVQREVVRSILSRTPFIENYRDAPPEAGGWGATIAELDLTYSD